ncbi:Uncharacterised protein [Klebsiella pneumoniae]|nr:Uncharacterised protein [Klebsiella pneumoniae]
MTVCGLMMLPSPLSYGNNPRLPRHSSICFHQAAWASWFGVSPISLTIATISVRTLSTGPTIGMSALMVLEIDAGSMSMWMILAFGQNFAAPLMTRSSKRAPTARITSL